MVSCLLFVSFFLVCALGYLPIVMMHGFALNRNAGTHRDWDDIRATISRLHPNTTTIALALFEGLDSTRPLTEQLPVLVQTIRNATKNFASSGWIGMGHSQGGLLMRCVAQQVPGMKKLISLAGVQNGYYGLPFAIPIIGKTLPLDVITDLMYSKLFQDEFSVAGFWMSPNHQRFLQHSTFLPYQNNELQPNASYKAQFLSLQSAHFFASPDDGDIYPWQSEIFGMYNSTGNGVINMKDTNIYRGDLFGLKTLDQRNALHLHVVPGIQHAQWLHNMTNFEQNVLPLLD